MKTLVQLFEDLSLDVSKAIRRELDTNFKGFRKHQNRHDIEALIGDAMRNSALPFIRHAAEYVTPDKFKSGKHINSGYCVQFAEYILDHVHSRNVKMMGDVDHHVMLKDNVTGLYYDAEHPDGITLEDFRNTTWMKNPDKVVQFLRNKEVKEIDYMQ
ncbi:gp150 [Sphingomonas phage PAU]|uniref:gp150 n=1 Tax=Sphingomonas phage PAU TaxID=1150991 RepID=UPI00025732E2|nr:gp150 [Sphingomonas phage PAU]AFF28148.1 gp150 [Sphingomonas phage PAU]